MALPEIHGAEEEVFCARIRRGGMLREGKSPHGASRTAFGVPVRRVVLRREFRVTRGELLRTAEDMGKNSPRDKNFSKPKPT